MLLQGGEIMSKAKKMKWHCIDCGYTEVNHKHMDGMRCPKCGKNGWIGELVKRVCQKPILKLRV